MIYLIQELTGTATFNLEDLHEENSRHLKALRPELGEEVAFLNLKGKAIVCNVINTRPVKLQFVRELSEPESAPKTHLFLAPPADSALEQAIEQATEVGYDVIHFLRSQRVQFPSAKPLPISRLKRVIQSSCKQCGRLWAPVLDETFYDFALALDVAKNFINIGADEGEKKKSWGSQAGKLVRGAKDLAVFIGPEGGWSPEEREILRARTQVFSLGPHVLRVPTAVVSAYALIWKELSDG